MKELYAALLSVQTEMPKIDKDGKNPHYKNAYATLPNVLSTVLPIMHKHGLFFTSSETKIDNDEYLLLEIIHAGTGNKITSNVKLINIPDMQKLGSAYTYGTRYGLLAMLGISPDLDDDGNSVSLPQQKTETKPKPESKPATEVKTAPDDLCDLLALLIDENKEAIGAAKYLDKVNAALKSKQLNNVNNAISWIKNNIVKEGAK